MADCCSLQSGGGVGHDQVHAGGNEAVGDGGAGSGVALCVLEVELHVVAELCGQSVLKALRCSVQSGVLHQLADADGVACRREAAAEPAAAEDATEEAAVEDAEEPPQAVRAAAAPQTAAAARNERRVILRIMITPSFFHLRGSRTPRRKAFECPAESLCFTLVKYITISVRWQRRFGSNYLLK